ncbi:heme A synthase [Hwanghaeella grinnelliae]|uniref:Heme A synthase n=1 Tax=Hwanghaeella grinnelliae TaxID=2500179 RepID=A0A437QQM5_9PROT|nr:COX15/CtaA family protein [Hwanghaeella grinnelliae]RVU36816.1 heme A synthase [Hwanghaeella grinnelliae]
MTTAFPKAASSANPPSPSSDSARAVGLWLLVCCVMVFAMMLIGAVTRLTESGLSMVEWRPLIGALPPMTEAEWQRVFDLYRQTSEYRIDNAGMSLAEFQSIFWWEFIHRLWGRTIGLVFALPFFFFLATRRIPTGYAKHLVILLFLGGLQGVIGWWMVKSGFVDRSDVSQYRLAVHLGMAFFILAYLLWLALGLLWPVPQDRPPAPRGVRRLGAYCHAVIFITVMSGALVAGLNAGLLYNDWPLMGGNFIPEDIAALSPAWLNIFENEGTVQFDHRIMAYLTLTVVSLTWIFSRRAPLAPRARLSVNCLAAMVWIQAGLGISTLVLMVPLPLAVLHQAGAATSFCLSIWVMKELRGAR